MSSHRLGDQVGRHRHQHSGLLQAGPQIVLVLPFGKELVTGPVHGDQQARGLDSVGRGHFPGGLPEAFFLDPGPSEKS